MATYYAVLAHKGEGWLGGLFTNLSDAVAYVGTAPKWGSEIITVVTDDAVGLSMNNHLQSGKPVRVTMLDQGHPTGP